MSKPKKTNIDIILAQAVSWALNPFFIFPIAIIFSHLDYINYNPWAFVFFVLVGGFPILFYYLYVEHKHKEKPWQFFISIPRERRNTILLMAVYTFIFNTILFSMLGEAFWQKVSTLLVVYSGLMYLANRYFDKASWHAGVFAFSIFYIADKISLAFTFLLILLPVLYWARILLHKHTWLQLYMGTVIGLVIGILSWTIH